MDVQVPVHQPYLLLATEEATEPGRLLGCLYDRWDIHRRQTAVH